LHGLLWPQMRSSPHTDSLNTICPFGLTQLDSVWAVSMDTASEFSSRQWAQTEQLLSLEVVMRLCASGAYLEDLLPVINSKALIEASETMPQNKHFKHLVSTVHRLYNFYFINRGKEKKCIRDIHARHLKLVNDCAQKWSLTCLRCSIEGPLDQRSEL
jgi:hypothetical protein